MQWQWEGGVRREGEEEGRTRALAPCCARARGQHWRCPESAARQPLLPCRTLGGWGLPLAARHKRGQQQCHPLCPLPHLPGA